MGLPGHHDSLIMRDIGNIAAGRFDAAELTDDERLKLIERLCDQDSDRRNQRRKRREANTRGAVISVVLVLQGLTDLHMWARV